jgi:hypothetical protein
MATTQLITNKYRLQNALNFVNSFSTVYNSVSAAITGTLTNGNTWISAISSNTGVAPGQIVNSTVSGIPTSTTVMSVNASVIVMSAAYTGTTTAGAAVSTYNSTTSGYYAFAGQAVPWPSGVVPQVYDNPNTVEFSAYNNMLFGKTIHPSDVSLMIDANAWAAGVAFAMYDDQDTLLTQKPFYVYTTSGNPVAYYYVWKCLYNNNGAVSTVAPQYSDTTASSTYYQTSDGYQWKYMYRFPVSTYNKFATSLYIPITPDANVTGNAVSGCIDVIIPVDVNGNKVIQTGSGYNNYYNGYFTNTSVVSSTASPTLQLDTSASKTTNYYTGCYLYLKAGTGAGQYQKIFYHFSNNSGTFVQLSNKFSPLPDSTTQYTISPAVTIKPAGDSPISANGQVAAMALVNAAAANSVYAIQVLSRGFNIYSATAFVNVSSQVGVSNAALLRVISSPKGGHGSNVAAELYCNTVGVSVTFANSELSTIPTSGSYQSVGIIKNPLFANVTLGLTTSTGSFTVGETVVQTIGNVVSTGVVTMANPLQITNATGTFTASTNSSYGLVIGATSQATGQVNTTIQINGVTKGFRTFSQLYAYNGFYTTGSFLAGNTAYQGDPNYANAVFFSNTAAGTTVYLTNKLGPIYSSNTINNYFTNSSSKAQVVDNISFTINTVQGPDLIAESGDVMYIENFSAVTRSTTQSETIKLILNY